MSIKRNILKNQIPNLKYSELIKVAQEMGNEAAVDEIKKYAGQIGKAVLIACKTEFKVGIGRMRRFTDVLNENLPAWLQFEVDPEDFKQAKPRTKLNQEQVYDLAECLIAVNCNRSCNKKPEKCELHRLMKEKDIPAWDETGKCEYKIEFKIAN